MLSDTCATRCFLLLTGSAHHPYGCRLRLELTVLESLAI